jgi:flagellar motor component MotA
MLNIPSDIAQQQLLAQKIRKLTVFALSRKTMAEDEKEIIADIKRMLGKGTETADIKALVQASVDAHELITKAKDKVIQAEEAIDNYSVIAKYSDRESLASDVDLHVYGVEE